MEHENQDERGEEMVVKVERRRDEGKENLQINTEEEGNKENINEEKRKLVVR